MNKLETQINQIYLSPPENKKCSLVLYEERLSPTLHLFVILELADMQRKTEATALKKIADIILSDFRANSRISPEAMFESTLAQTNQHLADLAHTGQKSWLGKLSAAVAVKSESEIFLATSGQACVWLKRKNELSEIISAEKKGLHPLKTFSNFASGKLMEGDVVAMLTTSVFNYVSLPLFGKLLKLSAESAAQEISKILIDSSGQNDAFAAFFLDITSEPKPAAGLSETTQVISPRLVAPAYPEDDLYAPLPENLEPRTRGFRKFIPRIKLPSILSWRPSLPNLGRLALPFRPRLPSFYHNLSLAGKFFFICFLIFIILAAANLSIVFVKMRHKKGLERIENLINAVNQDLSDAETALIYKNEDEAAKRLGDSKAHLKQLEDLDGAKAAELEPKVEELASRVTRTNSVKNPRVVTEVKLSPVFLAKAGEGFLLSGSDPKSLSAYSDGYKQTFMLNSVSGDITGINHIPLIGNFAVSKDAVYRINAEQNQFEQKLKVPNGDLFGIKYLDPNRVYILNRADNQIIRTTVAKEGIFSSPQPLLKTGVNLAEARDFGMDADIYILYATGVKKFVGGKEQAYKLSVLPDPLTDASKIFVGSNLYILDASKKRVLIFAKNGSLLNQIFFPSLGTAKDLYVNEQQRVINILDSDKLVEITF